MDIREIKRIVELTKKVNCESSALISEVAKEMGVKKTALMQFIEDSPKLFALVKRERRTKNKVTTIGMAIKRVYLNAEDNPDTEEWLIKMQKEWYKKLHVGVQTYYGVLEYYFFPVEDNGYRNTKEDMAGLEREGVLVKTDTGYGGLGDYYHTSVYLVNDAQLNRLKEAGWTTDFEEIKKTQKP